jgi:hypothetical protein
VHFGAGSKDVAFLRQAKADLDQMKAKYSAAGEYWPSMVAPYFWPDVDAILKSLQ